MYCLPADAKHRQQYNYFTWTKYLRDCKGKILEYNEDYYKYLRGISVIRNLEPYEQDYMTAYDHVVLRAG